MCDGVQRVSGGSRKMRYPEATSCMLHNSMHGGILTFNFESSYTRPVLITTLSVVSSEAIIAVIRAERGGHSRSGRRVLSRVSHINCRAVWRWRCSGSSAGGEAPHRVLLIEETS